MKIAIAGSGLSGLAAGWLLQDAGHDITIFGTADNSPQTVIVPPRSNLVSLFDYIQSPLKPAAKPFSLKRDLLSPRFYRTVLEKRRFYAGLQDYMSLENDEGYHSLGSYLRAHKYSPCLVEDYLAPLCTAIWQLPFSTVQEFALHFFGTFFETYDLFPPEGKQHWYHLDYAPLAERMAPAIRPDTPVTLIQRRAACIIVNGEEFDQAIMAGPAPETLVAMKDANIAEKTILGAFEYIQGRPAFNLETQSAQPNVSTLQGKRRTWFCGDWCGYGLPEDAIGSALAVAEKQAGAKRPWDSDRLALASRHAIGI